MRSLLSPSLIIIGTLLGTCAASAGPASFSDRSGLPAAIADSIAWRTVCDQSGRNCQRIWVDRGESVRAQREAVAREHAEQLARVRASTPPRLRVHAPDTPGSSGAQER
jgi:hypothetical protein